jgi:hypothetical protein
MGDDKHEDLEVPQGDAERVKGGMLGEPGGGGGGAGFGHKKKKKKKKHSGGVGPYSGKH